jgi:hypothetical protein
LRHETDALWGKLGMMLGYPLLYEGAKLLGFLHEFFRFGLRHNLGRVIVENVALAPTRIKVARQVCDAWPQRKLDGFEGGLVMSDTDDPIPGTGDGHFGKLEDSIIGCGKLAIGGEARQPRVFEVPLDDGTQPCKLSAACAMRLYPVMGQ